MFDKLPLFGAHACEKQEDLKFGYLRAYTENTLSSHWYVYMVLTECGVIYTGIAVDVKRRFAEHVAMFDGQRNAKGAKFFRGRKPCQVIYIECVANRSSASKREWQLKKLSHRQKTTLSQKYSVEL